MDTAKFQEAQAAYDVGDYRTAAKAFLASAGRENVGNGAAYHRAGNALMRLRRHADAITVYQHALRDETYSERGAVLANLGAAHLALGDLSSACSCYEEAVEEPGYATPYKAWQGIAATHMERGRLEEAAGAYRRAALDETNPDPGKALVNLGLCFMALGRPKDAVDAYQAALGFENFKGRGRALANLGQAYEAMGAHPEAVRAFEKATQFHSHALTPAAADAYAAARAATSSTRETVEGWVTGEIPPVNPFVADAPGWDTDQLAALGGGLGGSTPQEVSEAALQPDGLAAAARSSQGTEPSAGAVDMVGPVMPGNEQARGAGAQSVHDAAAAAADNLGFGDDQAVSDFFTRSEEDMKVAARESRRSSGKALARPGVRIAVIAGVVVVVLGIGIVATYLTGFGWPTQRSTVNGLFVAYSKGESVEDYWVAVPDADVAREMAKVPPVDEFVIDTVDPGRTESQVGVTVTPQDGGEMQYTVTLTREGVGWRVTGVDYRWQSTGS